MDQDDSGDKEVYTRMGSKVTMVGKFMDDDVERIRVRYVDWKGSRDVLLIDLVGPTVIEQFEELPVIDPNDAMLDDAEGL